MRYPFLFIPIPSFKPIEFDRFKNEAGGNGFAITKEKSTTNKILYKKAPPFFLFLL